MRVLTWIWSIIAGVLNAIVRTIVFALILVGVLVGIGMLAGDGLPRNMVLELDLRQSPPDKSASSLLDLGRGKTSIMDAVFTLDVASRDRRVKGVFLRVGSGDLSVPKAEELRDALKRFQAANKFVIAHSQTFYSSGLGDYEVAATANELWMQPVSTFFTAGTGATTMFFKGLFDKIDAVPQFVQRYEYKNAANVFTETDYTAAHREATTRLLQSWYDNAVTEAAADRKIERSTLVETLDGAPVQVEEVHAKNIITDVGYDEDARDSARRRAGQNVAFVRFERYALQTSNQRSAQGGPVIAFIHAAGDIVEGDDDDPLNQNSNQITGDAFSRAIRAAGNDKSVKAIVLRVDSPGGSAIASDQILAAVRKAQSQGKPVVISMGSVAASGGYYISAYANKIVAEPGTITGSIGVLWGKVALGKTAEKVGVEAKELGVGKNALFLSGMTPWDDAQLAKVNAQADTVYADFTNKVSEGRKLPIERVNEIARGRVWSGTDAKERGLVDDLGGFWTALDDAKSLANIPSSTRVVFKQFPTRQGVLGALSKFFDDSETSIKALQGLNTLMDSPPVKMLTTAVQSMPDGRVQFKATDLPEH